MKVFLAGTSFRPEYGGPAVSVSRLALAMAEFGIDVAVWAPDGTALSTPLLPQGTRIKRLGGNICGAIAEFGPIDLVHDNGIWLRYHHKMTCLTQQHKIPRIVSTRGMLEPWAFAHKRWKKHLAWSMYQKRDLMRASHLHATSDQEAHNLKQRGLAAPIITIANGVDIPDEHELGKNPAIVRRDGERVALFLGRLYPVKGLPMLLEAWSCVRPKGWVLRIAGPDEAGHRRDLQGIVSKLGLADCVSFPGKVAPHDRLRVYAGANLFILPSYSESFGMAVAEALAHGLPVLTTTGTPWPYLLTKGCGWRVTATVEALSYALREATSCDVTTLQEMGRKGREYVAADYGWPAVAKSMSELYRAAVKRHNSIQ